MEVRCVQEGTNRSFSSSMNGDSEEQSGPLMNEFDPQWMSDGGISGGEGTEPRFDDSTSFESIDYATRSGSGAGGDPLSRADQWRLQIRRGGGSRRNWDTRVTTKQNQSTDGGCI